MINNPAWGWKCTIPTPIRNVWQFATAALFVLDLRCRLESGDICGSPQKQVMPSASFFLPRSPQLSLHRTESEEDLSCVGLACSPQAPSQLHGMLTNWSHPDLEHFALWSDRLQSALRGTTLIPDYGDQPCVEACCINWTNHPAAPPTPPFHLLIQLNNWCPGLWEHE